MTTEQKTPTVDPIPAGYTSLTPYFCCRGAAEAIDFYTAVLGATVISRMEAPDGTIAHAELEVANGRMQLSDPAPDHNLAAPDGGDVVSRSTVFYCPDVDAVHAAAIDAGAKSYGEPDTFVTGDRYAAFLDPFGHRWAVMTRVEDVDPDEAERRVNAWLEEESR
ncbi:VOC family protein [Nocardioides sp. Root151]|uniref:VOC family protein n=1 Tax=Nocardioides sp. Root151 TaxID=1736475 RepID=UPI000702CDAB|nr:VOC family protein [Nocardioides sp. Root151]KQZ70898.1 glyoxalase [Nocardioides sp. Root151]